MHFFEILPRTGNMHTPLVSSPDPKGHVNFCHHFAFVVRPSTITKKYSHLKPLGHLGPNFGGMVIVFDATFNNILVVSWRSALLVEETRVSGENLTTCSKSLYHILLYRVHNVLNVVPTHNVSDDRH
jgi:hypothetical protein